MPNSNILAEMGVEEEIENVEVDEPETEEPEQEEAEAEFDESEADDSDDEVETDEPDDEPPAPQSYRDDPEEVDRAKRNGWTPYEDFVKNGGDPKQWKTAKHFNEYGDMVDKHRQMQRDFDERLRGVQALYTAKIQDMQSQRQQLESQKREAVENGDWDGVQRIDKQLAQNATQQYTLNNEVAREQQVYQQREAQIEDEWMARNPWVSDINNPESPNHQKAVFTAQLYNQLVQNNVPVERRLQLMDEELSKRFNQPPQANAKRDSAPVTDGKQAKRSAGNTLTFADLTAEEKQDWKKFGDVLYAGDKKAFLQVVKDTRKGAKK